jgi:hypothetical protein
MSVSKERNERMKDITKKEVSIISPVVKARIDERLAEFKKADPVAWWRLSERDYLELVKKFHKEECDKYLAEVMGW